MSRNLFIAVAAASLVVVPAEPAVRALRAQAMARVTSGAAGDRDADRGATPLMARRARLDVADARIAPALQELMRSGEYATWVAANQRTTPFAGRLRIRGIAGRP